MHVTILVRRWNLRFVRTCRYRGECDPPDEPGKQIRIAGDLRRMDLLEVLIHEATHAANWHLDEEHVDQFARDLARMLWRLGYRSRDDEST